MSKVINSNNAPAAIGPYVQAVDLGNMVFTSGQIPLNAKGELVEGGVVAQTRQSLENIKAILAAADLTPANIVKTTVFVKDLNNFGAVNGEYEKFFTENKHPSFPARSCVEVARLPKDVEVEIEVIAVR
ncbi:RidA family protein [Orbaceae bacterium ac157xtp]